jgi:hypothetical protein
VPNGPWWLIGNVPLHVPAGFTYIENAVSFVFAMPPYERVELQFTLNDICPEDSDSWNNVALGGLPWYVSPNTPVVVTDFTLESTPDGVVIRWRSSAAEAVFALERHVQGTNDWVRLAAPQPGIREREEARFQVLDRSAEAGAELEYRLWLRAPEGDAIVATASLRHDAAMPHRVVLRPVRPNPFRAGGAIEYAVPEPRSLELCIYDAAGRRVAVLQSGVHAAGWHTVAWNGREDHGTSVPAGVYFCRLTAGGSAQTQRLVLVH